MFDKEIMIGSKKAKNRIAAVAVCIRQFTQFDGEINYNQLDRYRSINNNGFGLIIVESSAVEQKSQDIQTNIGIWSDKQIEGLRSLAEICKANNTLAVIQLNFRTNQDIEALDQRQFEVIRQKYIYAAYRAKKAGFDGIELHGAHGFFINRILSQKNDRIWRYGREKEKKIKFVCELIREIKLKCGQDFLVGVRIGCNDPDLATSIFYAKALEEAGADYLNPSNGMGGGKKEKFLTDDLELGIELPKDFEFTAKIYAAAKIKEVIKIPIIATGQIFTKEKADKILENNYADIIGVGRGLLADPLWGKHVLNDENVNICCACEECFCFIDINRCPARKKLIYAVKETYV